MGPITKIAAIITFGVLPALQAQAQKGDSIRTRQLDEVVIQSQRFKAEHVARIQDAHTWYGKKSEVVNLDGLDVNVADKTPRQIFAKVPGVFVYDMDGTGNQMNISTRGLDPHRGWEYNIRKNGIITNSDMYGYPASHYSMPMEAVERVEIVRGTGSLQYGAQFGGMLNYVSKKPDSTRAITFETINTMGSFNMLSSYNAIGGTLAKGKVQYYAYYNKRTSDGYRTNAHTDYDAQSFMLLYAPSKRVKIKVELGRSSYVYRIPGPLTDSMFHADPRASTRSRNYFNPDIYVPSVSLGWKLSDNTFLSWTVSAVLGARNSVQFDKLATIRDAIDPATGQYAPRQVDIDNFHSYTTELRLLHHYRIGSMQSALSGGLQVFNNDLHRRQLGKGTTGTDFDLTLTDPTFGRDLHFKTKNLAVFLENAFTVAPNFVITPGMRFETGQSDVSGGISYIAAEDLPNTIKHTFPLFGITAEYALKENHNLYGGWAQSYRPVVFKDIIPASTYERVDKDLKDARGYNLDIGYRGTQGNFRWDVGLFQLRYDNRLGTLEVPDQNSGLTYIYRTNIGNSVTNGAEIFIEYTQRLAGRVSMSLFTSTALFDGHYTSAQVKSGKNAGGSTQSENVDVSGNKIETVPAVITRNGVTMRYQKASVSFLYSYTAKSYADPLNTETPSATGAVGVVPAYGILDINATCRLSSNLMIRANLNNVTNEQYFTKRPSFYPGPGVWSSDGRSFNVTLGLKI